MTCGTLNLCRWNARRGGEFEGLASSGWSSGKACSSREVTGTQEAEKKQKKIELKTIVKDGFCEIHLR